MKIIISGVLLGLTIAFSFGPGFWALLEVTANKGFKKGLLFLSGFFLSDLLFIFIALFSLKAIMNGLTQSFYFGLISSIAMITFGIFTIFKKQNKTIANNRKNIPFKLKKTGLILKGFIFNTSNPFNLVFWIGIITISTSAYGLKTSDFYVFIISIILTSVSSDVIKCFFASRLQNIINAFLLNIISKITGLVMIGSGIYIFFKICLKM